MTSDPLVNQLATDIRETYREDPGQARQRISALVKSRLSEVPADQGHAMLGKLLACFAPVAGRGDIATDNPVLARALSLILGRRVSPEDLSSGELLERLAQSLNTIFNTLNQLISVINMTFSGGAPSGEQTIRQFIGFHLEGEDQTQSLEDYLGQINQAFLTTQEAFKNAAHTKVGQILQALDPEKIAAERGGGLKIGPLRKAEDFDILKEKIERIRRWYDSGRFMEDYIREFEKNCQSFTRK